MSRYIFSPSYCKGNFLLLPTEGISDHVKTIELPDGVFPNFSYNELLIKLSKANVQRSKDGVIMIDNKPMNVKFDDFVQDCCNKNFKECYEPIFCSLRHIGVTF